MGRGRFVGIRSWKGGRQAYLQVQGRTYAKSFPISTPLEVLREWRQTTRRRFAGLGPIRGSFAADITAYLTRVRAMPTYAQRAAHLACWADALGRDRPRQTITATEIDAVIQTWLRTPSTPAPGARGRPSGPEGIAAATVRKRRTALVSFFRTLDGPQVPNPARASAAPRPPKPEARGLDYPTIERILQAAPECRTKRRLAVLAYTGLPPGLLATVTPIDLNLKAKTVRLRPRRKGTGVEARTVPLTPDGVKAFAAFHRANAYGAFAVGAVNVSFKRACRRIGLVGPTLYDLRHSYLTLLYRVTKDLATVARFGLHASLATTARYAQAAMKEVDEDAAARVGQALRAQRKLSRQSVPHGNHRNAS
jgi:integrase